MLGDIQKAALKEKFNYPYDSNGPIINFYKHIEKCLKLAKDANDIDFATGQVLHQALFSLPETGLYQDKVK